MLYGHYAGNNKSFPDFVQKGERNVITKIALILWLKCLTISWPDPYDVMIDLELEKSGSSPAIKTKKENHEPCPT